MKTIKIRQDVKDKLDEFPDAKTITKTMKILVENAETYEQYSSDNSAKTHININMDDKVFEKFLKCKKYPNETHSDTIERLLNDYNKNR